MKGGPVGDQQGVALLVTVAFLAMVASGSLLLSRKVRSAYLFNAVTGRQIRLYHMAESGINAAKAVLIGDKKASEIDVLFENWADPAYLAGLLEALPFGEGRVTVSIHDVAGRRLRTLDDRVEQPGPKAVWWDRRDDAGSRVAAGVYWARLETPSGSLSTRIVAVD